MKSKTEFVDFFESTFGGKKNKITKKIINRDNRKRFVKVYSAIIIISALIAMGVFFYLKMQNIYNNTYVFFIIPVIAFILYMMGQFLTPTKSTKIQEKQKENKTQIIDFLLSDEPHAFMPTNFVSQSLFINSPACKPNSNIINYTGEDYLSFAHNADFNNFVLSDIEVTEQYTYQTQSNASKNNTPTYTTHTVDEIMFSGMFGYAELAYPSPLTISINSNNTSTLQKCEFESEEFNKTFRIYANDQIKARQFLTVNLMGKLMTGAKKSSARISLYMQGNSLYFYRNKQLFDTSNKVHSFSAEKVEPLYDDIKLILDIKTHVEKFLKDRF
ncbi:MAG: DUF3137 domain-containing protein [Clostridia bacterium]